MDMYEKYRGYGNYKAQAIVIGTSLLICLSALLIMEIPAVRSDRTVSGIMNVILALFVPAMLIGGMATKYARSSFLANDINVTFKEPMTPKVTIDYRDIIGIDVFHEYKRERRGRYGYDSFYVETVIINTINGEYTFKGRMDIAPNPALEATGKMDKLFEMGRFKVLQQFIEAKIARYYKKTYQTDRDLSNE